MGVLFFALLLWQVIKRWVVREPVVIVPTEPVWICTMKNQKTYTAMASTEGLALKIMMRDFHLDVTRIVSLEEA